MASDDPAVGRRAVSAATQFRAVLRKNLLLRLRGGRKWFGLGGWFAAAVDVLVPVLFFVVMCIPKHYMRPVPQPRQVSALYPADSAAWGELYQGPAAAAPNNAARLLFAPNTSDVTRLMLLLAKGAACPPDAARPRRSSSSSFFHFFSAAAKAAATAHPECGTSSAACQAQPACYLPLFEAQLVGHAGGAEAEAAALSAPGTVDAILDFSAWQAALDAARPVPPPNTAAAAAGKVRAGGQPLRGRRALEPGAGGRGGARLPGGGAAVTHGGLAGPLSYAYTLRMNHSEVPPTRLRLNQFDLLPGNQYKQYWFFANLQTLVEQAILADAADRAASGSAASRGSAGGAGQPADPASAAAGTPPLPPLLLSVKPFPWPAVALDLGATAAALFFNMLLVFAFLQPTRAAVMSVVQERELLLREGMRLLGLRDGAYWASWGLSHWGGMAASGALCALVGLYPFQHSSLTLMLAFYWLVAAALLLFAYCLSTLFTKTRVAGGAGAVLYSLAMVPGYLMPSLQPYGGAGWSLACLLPPSAISLFASVLVRHEAVQQGLTWRTLGQPVTVEHGFSAASVYRMLLLDVLLYSVLLWYLDNVMPSDVGRQLPWSFPFSRHYWRPAPPPAAAADRAAAVAGAAGGGDAAVRLVGLRKVFRTTDGMDKVAVDGLSLDIPRGRITALLGHNGAGKSTTISILTGLLPATAGDVLFFPASGGGGGLSVARDMAAIRGTLGVCPQYDVLWPQLSVREHLELFAAIKGFTTRKEQAAVAAAAAAEVGLGHKLGAAAGELSGGQRRKLSVALAFVGDPAVVVLDEPTSGMDPYTRRFTWGVIQARRAQQGTAVLLTSHSMEEADLLADTIAIMAHGRLAACGTSLELKSQLGAGYTLTASLAGDAAVEAAEGGADGPPLAGLGPSAASSQVERLTALLREHVADAQLLSASGSEASYRLPKEAAAFPGLLRELGPGGAAAALGVTGYGLSEATLEQVFLRVSEAAAADAAHADAAAGKRHSSGGKPDGQEAGGAPAAAAPPRDEFLLVHVPRSSYLRGFPLWCQQLRALLAKRALCTARDWWAAGVQVAVPVLLVLLALWSNRLSATLPQQPALPLDRAGVLSGNPAAYGAAADVRGAGGGAALAAFAAGYPQAQDSGTDRLLTLPLFEKLEGSLDGWLLDQWYSGGTRRYDAFFLQTLPANLSQGVGGELRYSVLANQTAIHALPAAISQVHSALLRWLTGDAGAGISLTAHPLPALSGESDVRLTEQAANLLLVMCVVLAVSVLSASFAVFLVRERASGSKAVQLVTGAAPSAFWAANLAFDVAYYSVPAALMTALFAAFRLPAFSGARLAAAAALLWAFAPAGLCLTYLLQAGFQDEVRALVRCNSLFFTAGYLGFLAVWILDTIALYLPSRGVNGARATLRAVLQSLSPHFCVARGMHQISNTYKPDFLTRHLGQHLAGTVGGGAGGAAGWSPSPYPGQSPWAWEVTGQLLTSLAAQALLYGGAVLAVEAGVPLRAWRHVSAAWARPAAWRGGGYRALPGGPAGGGQRWSSGATAHAELVEGEEGEEDEDVAAERLAIQGGQLTAEQAPVLLAGVSKTFWQAPEGPTRGGHGWEIEPRAQQAQQASGAVRAVRDLWLSIGARPGGGGGAAGPGQGQCFGLLGVNGAGKTTTFRMITGEVEPDGGDVLVQGLSVVRSRAAARRLMGYCPQASALPPQMTGREVLRMCARLRGLPERLVPTETDRLLRRLGLAEFADRACGSYSGGNRRKLATAAALVGAAPLVLLDEPSTGMDPGARRALWGVIGEEMAAGRTVLLTSHSMEECEAVCSRLGIMSSGRLSALGSVQRVKSKHGQGYSLEMRVPPGCAAAAAQLVMRACPAAQRRADGWRAAAPGHDCAAGGGDAAEVGGDGDVHLSFLIPRERADLAALFAGLEAARAGGGGGGPPPRQPLVLQYSLSQTTLEQVFLALAAAAPRQQ